MENKKSPKELIIDILKEKACLKQDVFKKTISIFKDFKEEAEKLTKQVRSEMQKIDKDISVEFIDKAEFEFHIKYGGDILVFFMHTNVFDFDKSHNIWNTSYIKEDELRSYCGMINIYNFLADSFKYNRINDIGYLVARFFVNKDLHYFVEGKRQLGFLYNNFTTRIINKNKIREIIESSIIYSMDFDLLTPSFDSMKEVSVDDVIQLSSAMTIKTGKRLGFKFSADNDSFE